jgi:hypothetical protein
MSSKRELLKEALGALTGFLAMGWDSLNPLRDKIEAELAKPDQSIMAIWDVYSGDKILQTITAPIGWDAKNVKDNLIENHYAEHLHVKLRCSNQYSQGELAKPEEEDKFRMGAKAMFDWFQFRAANHYHGNPKIQAQCDAENEFVLEWAEQALEDVSPETFFEWRKLSEALAENQKLKQELSKPEAEPVKLCFPTMLRKMWSGGEVQKWLDEQPPLYTSPRPMQRLTDDEVMKTLNDDGENLMTTTPETDRELLELAAKAAGYEFDWPTQPMIRCYEPEHPDKTHNLWNPLEDDGDALRLALDLGIAVTPYPIYENPKHSVIAKVMNLFVRDGSEKSNYRVEIYGSDKYAAARKAITRVAAEIGKSMP